MTGQLTASDMTSEYGLPIGCSRDEWPDEVCHVPVIPHHALSDAEALAKTARVLLGIPEPWGVAE